MDCQALPEEGEAEMPGGVLGGVENAEAAGAGRGGTTGAAAAGEAAAGAAPGTAAGEAAAGAAPATAAARAAALDAAVVRLPLPAFALFPLALVLVFVSLFMAIAVDLVVADGVVALWRCGSAHVCGC